jgi:hypothetical protein
MAEIRPYRRLQVIAKWKLKPPGIDSWKSKDIVMEDSLEQAVSSARIYNAQEKKRIEEKERTAQPRRASGRLKAALLTKVSYLIK